MYKAYIYDTSTSEFNSASMAHYVNLGVQVIYNQFLGENTGTIKAKHHTKFEMK